MGFNSRFKGLNKLPPLVKLVTSNSIPRHMNPVSDSSKRLPVCTSPVMTTLLLHYAFLPSLVTSNCTQCIYNNLPTHYLLDSCAKPVQLCQHTVVSSKMVMYRWCLFVEASAAGSGFRRRFGPAIRCSVSAGARYLVIVSPSHYS